MRYNIAKKLILAVTAFICAAALCLSGPRAAAYETPGQIDYDMETLNFSTHVYVRENGRTTVTEKIKVNFLVQKHGIYRYIPIKGLLQTENAQGDYETIDYESPIYDVRSKTHKTDKSVISNNNGSFQQVILGSADVYLYGIQDFELSYSMALPTDLLGGDLMYMNIFPSEWQTGIGKASFVIEYEKPFDISGEIKLLGGANNEFNDINFEINGNKIIGECGSELPPHTGVTLLHKLGADYFGADNTFLYIMLACIALSLGTILTVYLIWLKYGKDEKPVQTVEVRPPAEFTPSEIGFMMDGRADTKDIVSLIFYWAEQDYLTIEEISNDDFKLTKKRVLDAFANDYEHTVFDKLFADGESVLISSLEGNFFAAIKTAKKQLIAKMVKNKSTKVFTKVSMTWQKAALFLAVIPIILAAANVCAANYTDTWIAVALAFGAAIVFGAGLYLVYAVRTLKIDSFAYAVVGFVIMGMILAACVLFSLSSVFALVTVISAAAAVAVCLLLAFLMPKRTKENNEIYGRLLGLKDFINRAEKDRLEALIEDNPNYFYDILPYAYVMGVSDKWAKNFESLAIEPPTWFSGVTVGDIFILSHLNRCYNRMFMCMMMRNVSHSAGAIVGAITSGGKGFGGGGGFKGFRGGGGFGGGGGGSW